jgi:hypothetical protein
LRSLLAPGQPAEGQTLSSGPSVTVTGGEIEAEQHGSTFKKNSTDVFVSIQDVHAL